MGWEVDEVEPITYFIINLWELLYVCYDRCEIVKLMVYLRWQLKFTSGWIEAPGVPSVACIFWKSRSTHVIFLWTTTQAQRELRLFMLETSVRSHKLLWALA